MHRLVLKRVSFKPCLHSPRVNFGTSSLFQRHAQHFQTLRFYSGTIPTLKQKIPEGPANLKYWKHYPRQIRNWIEDAHYPRGFYDQSGNWVIEEPAEETETLTLSEEDEKTASEALLPQTAIDEDLRTGYRFDLTEEDLKDVHPRLKNFFLLCNGSSNEQKHFRVMKMLERFRRDLTDTGSSEVQVAVMTVRIRYLEQHVKLNHKDVDAARHLKRLHLRRRKIMVHLRKNNPERYWDVVSFCQLEHDPAAVLSNKAIKRHHKKDVPFEHKKLMNKKKGWYHEPVVKENGVAQQN